MFQTNPSTLEQYVFNNVNNNFTGGFPMTEFINHDMIKREMLGGADNITGGTKRFENLAIPVGLVSFSNYYTNTHTKDANTVNNIDIIDDGQFNKLFGFIAEIKTRNHKGGDTTRNNKIKIKMGSTAKKQRT
jgi:hypothetical protein